MFNDAGVGGVVGSITDLPVDDWDHTFDVMVRGVFLGSKHAATQFRRQGGGGAIVNTASVAGLVGDGGPLCYSVAKAAVVHLTRAAAVELAADRIRVNAVCPGPILTPLMHGGRPERASEPMQPFVPWPNLGVPDGPGITRRGGLRTPPKGFVGVDRGSTGQELIVRQRPN